MRVTLEFLNTGFTYTLCSVKIMWLLVFASCISNRGGTFFGVPNGEYIVDVANCRRCLCDDGSLSDCEPSQGCQTIQPDLASCTNGDKIIPHGEKFEVWYSFYIMAVSLLYLFLNRLTATDVVATKDVSGVPVESVVSMIAVPLVITNLSLKCVD